MARSSGEPVFRCGLNGLTRDSPNASLIKLLCDRESRTSSLTPSAALMGPEGQREKMARMKRDSRAPRKGFWLLQVLVLPVRMVQNFTSNTLFSFQCQLKNIGCKSKNLDCSEEKILPRTGVASEMRLRRCFRRESVGGKPRRERGLLRVL